MKQNFDVSLRAVLKHEGGFANHPKDPGGATMKGVTQAVYDAYMRKTGRSTQSVRHISDTDLHAIYKKQYWDAVRGDDLPSGLDYCVFDFAVNSGPPRAAQYLQRTLGVTVDGQIGPQTIAAAVAEPARDNIIDLCKKRLVFLKRAKNKETGEQLWPAFGKGWQSRVDGVKKMALEMAQKPVEPEVTSTAPSQQEAQKPAAKTPVGLAGAIAAIVALVIALLAWLGFDIGSP